MVILLQVFFLSSHDEVRLFGRWFGSSIINYYLGSLELILSLLLLNLYDSIAPLPFYSISFSSIFTTAATFSSQDDEFATSLPLMTWTTS